jgi:type IV secretion system protein VirB10
LLGKPNNADLLGATGNEGNVNEHWGRILSAATISTILSVGAGLGSDRYSQSNNWQPNTRQSALAGASQGISNVGQQLTSRAMDIQPTITLPAGFEFNVIVKKDMVLTPYKNN